MYGRPGGYAGLSGCGCRAGLGQQESPVKGVVVLAGLALALYLFLPKGGR
jgi:MYXO-CTERM domain-containing protein